VIRFCADGGLDNYLTRREEEEKMSRETKLGIVVAASFVVLLGTMIGRKLLYPTESVELHENGPMVQKDEGDNNGFAPVQQPSAEPLKNVMSPVSSSGVTLTKGEVKLTPSPAKGNTGLENALNAVPPKPLPVLKNTPEDLDPVLAKNREDTKKLLEAIQPDKQARDKPIQIAQGPKPGEGGNSGLIPAPALPPAIALPAAPAPLNPAPAPVATGKPPELQPAPATAVPVLPAPATGAPVPPSLDTVGKPMPNGAGLPAIDDVKPLSAPANSGIDGGSPLPLPPPQNGPSGNLALPLPPPNFSEVKPLAPPTGIGQNPVAPAPIGVPPVSPPVAVPAKNPAEESTVTSTIPKLPTEPMKSLDTPIQIQIPNGGNTKPVPVINPPPINVNNGNTAGPTQNFPSYFEEAVAVKPESSTFEALSRAYYGSEKYAPALLEFNRKHPRFKIDGVQTNPPQLQLGQKVMIPEKIALETRYPNLIGSDIQTAVAKPIQPQIKTTQPQIPVTEIGSQFTGQTTATRGADGPVYVVQGEKEMLYEIARRVLGDSRRWSEIYRLNPGIRPEFAIPQGTPLRLPVAAKVQP
jgi:hypothetical protein